MTNCCLRCGGRMVEDDDYVFPYCASWKIMEGGCYPPPQPKKLITISYIAGEGIACDVEGCEEEASYMGGGKTQCTPHWTKK